MQTSNTEEMVTISRAEYEHLQQEKARNAKLEAKFAALEQEQAQVITSLTLQNEWLLEQLKLSKKKLFGRSSEQAEQMVMEQLSLTYNELEAYAFGTKAATEKQITVKAHERKRQSGNVLDVVPEGTPTEVVEHRLPGNERTCSACGSKLVEIGKEVRRSLMMKPAEFWVREDVYYTYACKNCEQETGEANIVKAAKEPALLPGSFASAEAVAYLAAQKFVMYSPLYRLEQEFNRQGLRLSRQTMANWLLNTSEKWLRPIYDALREQLCKEPVLHADETTLAGQLGASVICGCTGQAGMRNIPLCCMSTSLREKRSMLNISCKASQDGCTQTDTRDTTDCRATSVWWAAGHMRGENLTRRCKRCPRRCRRTLRQRLANAIAPDFSSWSRRLQS